MSGKDIDLANLRMAIEAGTELLESFAEDHFVLNGLKVAWFKTMPPETVTALIDSIEAKTAALERVRELHERDSCIACDGGADCPMIQAIEGAIGEKDA